MVSKIHSGLVLAQGAEFEGKLGFKGVGRICGHFKGEIITKALLIIEPSGRVEASIKAQEIVIKGFMKGTALAESISILSGSECYGTLHTNRLHIEEGALFEGQALRKNHITS